MNEIEALLEEIRAILPTGFRAEITRRPARKDGMWLLMVQYGDSSFIGIIWDAATGEFGVTRWAGAASNFRTETHGIVRTRAAARQRVASLLPQ